jgi:uncharacterized protein
MNDAMGFVLDTTVVVGAAMLPRSVPAQVVSLALSLGEILLSDATVKEAEGVLRRPKFDRYASLDMRLQVLVSLVERGRLVDVREIVRECRDPNDDMFLELAIAGEASCIVSGDKDLLILNPFRGIPILTPRAFLETTWRNSGAVSDPIA